MVKLAWGVVLVAYKVRTQIENYGNQRACRLIPYEGCQATDGTGLPHTTVNCESWKVAQDAVPLRDQSQRSGEIVIRILIQVIQCTYFVKEYCNLSCLSPLCYYQMNGIDIRLGYSNLQGILDGKWTTHYKSISDTVGFRS